MNIDRRFTIFACSRSGSIRAGLLALVKAAALFAAAGVLGGCETLGYYAQAVNGHAQLMHRARDIPDMLDDPSVSEEQRRKLRRVLDIRNFASSELSLPDNSSYRKFADLSGEAVVWALVATPEFSVDPLQWCYPVIGCAAYRGYFDRDDALAAGLRLGRQGRDWTAEPVPAYSTLGWFDDPLPGSVLGWETARLAGLVFHELAHQRLYLAGDSTFNESFASAIEHAGVQRWLEPMPSATGGAGSGATRRLSNCCSTPASVCRRCTGNLCRLRNCDAPSRRNWTAFGNVTGGCRRPGVAASTPGSSGR
jgi:predicted aminopeptidase